MLRMIKNKSLRDIIKITASNGVSLLSAIIMGFILPKIFSINDYGYYRTFTLYISYAGLFHFGIISGIYLKNSGIEYSELNKNKFKIYTKIVLIIELFVSFLTIFFTLFLVDDINTKIILFFVSIDIFIVNLSTYFQTISQMTFRFTELSIRNFTFSFLQLILVLILFILYLFGININYVFFISALLIINLLVCIWYILTYRDIFSLNVKISKSDICEMFEYIKLGLPLLISNLCVSFLLNLDRQFVNIEFSNHDYAIYSFAYSMLTLITTMTSSISMVLFPTLKKLKGEELKNKIGFYVEVILFFVSFALVLFFPLSIFLQWYLPKYIYSLEILKIILPSLLFSSVITIVFHNYYKVLNKNYQFMFISFLTLLISFFLNLFAYKFYGNMTSISFASVISMFIWYSICNIYFISKYKVKLYYNYIYILLIILGFWCVCEISNNLISMVVYIIYYLLITPLLYKNNLKKYFKRSNL